MFIQNNFDNGVKISRKPYFFIQYYKKYRNYLEDSFFFIYFAVLIPINFLLFVQ